VARYFIHFLSDESCGKCLPCREGLRQMDKILTNITEGKFCIPGHQYLSQVLFNIIHNSAMYDERENVEIEINAEIIDSRLVRIEFADHGPGILDPLKEFIFKRSGHPDAQVVGRGLGLTLADNIVRSLNGQIWVEDRVEGDPSKGAKFVCIFPVWTDETDLPCGGKKCITFYKSAHCFWCDPVYDLLMRLMEELSIARSIVELVDVDDPNADLPDAGHPRALQRPGGADLERAVVALKGQSKLDAPVRGGQALEDIPAGVAPRQVHGPGVLEKVLHRHFEHVFGHGFSLRAAATTHRRAYHNRHSHLVIVHPAKFCSVVDHLVSGKGDEIAEHDLNHRAQAAQRHASSQTSNPRLRDWRCNNSLRIRRG